jgi:tetratricopeptide (TPR) repeat protein
MKTSDKVKKNVDPCLQIQADLSAMLDGELAPASVRRVMVHSDVCPSCAGFLDGIRVQALAHQDLYKCLNSDADEIIEIHGLGGKRSGLIKVSELRKKLTENRDQLARIFYELGRGFVLMGLSPNFSRIVACEPVPIPDMFQRGRNLVDEVERLAAGPGWSPSDQNGSFDQQVGADQNSADQGSADQVGSEWVRAKALFEGGGLHTPAENLLKGKDLLHEALMLSPDFHEARIYLGHAYHVAQEKTLACREFKSVLRGAKDANMRGFALLNLGNVFLEEGELELATAYFKKLVDSGVVDKSPHFGLIYFNLALVYGLRELFSDCEVWLQKLYHEMPHKRSMIAEELRSRPQFTGVLSRHPEARESFARQFPCWFANREAC